MKTYTLFLDMLILSLLVLAIYFFVNDNLISYSTTSRRGTMRTMIVSWHFLLLVSGFCVFLKFIAQNIDRLQRTRN